MAAALIAVMVEPVGALTTKPSVENVRAEYIPSEQWVLITLTDGKWFGAVGHMKLYDGKNHSTQISVELTDFYQNKATGKLSWDDHVKLAGIANPYAHLPPAWGNYNCTNCAIDTGNNWLSVLTPRVTGMTYQDTSDGKSQATVTVSENIRYTQSHRICIVDKATQDEIECANSVSAVDKTATATFLNDHVPPAAAQLVISSGFVQSTEVTINHQWNMYTYAYDITYSGDPPPTVTDVSYERALNRATITASEAIQAANATNICIVNKATQAMVVCANSVSVSGSTVTADFLDDQISPPTTQLALYAGAIQDTSEAWNTAVFKYDVAYRGHLGTGGLGPPPP